MPLTASGKIIKRELARCVAEGRAAPLPLRRPGVGLRLMRAILVEKFGPPERLRVGDAPLPVPGQDEVLVEVHAAPVNYVDLLVVGGAYQFLPPFPFIPGKGPAGIVAALGPGVRALQMGDRVLAMAEQGGYAEAVAVSAEQCYRLPKAMSFTEAASLSLAYDTAWLALRDRARLEPGETVLVLGASGAVGQAAVQLGRAMGGRMLAGISRPERAAAALVAGAEAVIDLSRTDLRDSLREQVYGATGGCGADIILDPLGGSVFGAALRALAWRGRLVVIGFAAGAIPSIKTNYLLLKNIEVSGLQISDYRKRRPQQVARAFQEIFQLFEQGKIKPATTVRFSLEQAGTALAALRDRCIAGRAVLHLRDA
jgi:NADPH2:quinone reductase